MLRSVLSRKWRSLNFLLYGQNLALITITFYSIPQQLALINMLRSVDDGCRKNAVFCLKTMSQWKHGQDSLNQDLDIEQMLSALCNLLSCGDESLGRMAAV